MLKDEIGTIYNNEKFIVPIGKFIYIRGGALTHGDIIQVINIDEKQHYSLKLVEHGTNVIKGMKKVRIDREWVWDEKTFFHKLLSLERLRVAE